MTRLPPPAPRRSPRRAQPELLSLLLPRRLARLRPLPRRLGGRVASAAASYSTLSCCASAIRGAVHATHTSVPHLACALLAPFCAAVMDGGRDRVDGHLQEDEGGGSPEDGHLLEVLAAQPRVRDHL